MRLTDVNGYAAGKRYDAFNADGYFQGAFDNLGEARDAAGLLGRVDLARPNRRPYGARESRREVWRDEAKESPEPDKVRRPPLKPS